MKTVQADRACAGGVPLLLAQAELQGRRGLENLNFALPLIEARNKAGAESSYPSSPAAGAARARTSSS